MAVYTLLSEAQVARFIADFGFTQLSALNATDSGIENTNYFVTAQDHTGQSQRMVLTLFEMMPESELPYFVALTTYLAEQGLPVPAPFCDHTGRALRHLENKPAILVPCFNGQHPTTPTTAQCHAIATAMARMHLASTGFSIRRQNDRGAQWREQACHQLQPYLSPEQKELLLTQLAEWRLQQTAIDALPSGITHHDLFHDNALFAGDQLTGIIDFYNACHDVFLYDLAVLVNDWCSDEAGALIPARYEAAMSAYQAQRPLTPAEQQLWPKMLAFAALRFWISRLLSWHCKGKETAAEKEKGSVVQKDPAPMQRMLLKRCASMTHTATETETNKKTPGT